MPTLTPIDKNPFDEFYDATGADKPAPVGKAQLLGNILFGALPGPAKLASLPLNENFRKGFMEGMEKSGRVGVQSMMEALENQYKPDNAVAVNDAGEWLDQSGKVIPSQRRPNLLPITKSQPGQGWFGSNFEGAMPAMADIWNTMGGVGGKATLGAGPMLRPALKYQDKIYKAKEGQQHLDALPAHLQDTFQKMAMSGEDISHFDFGFINHKGHFLTREKALEYAIKEGILDPNDAKYGTLVTTMLNDSGGGQKLASQAAAQIREMKAPTFYSAAEKAVEGIKQNKASGDQWLSTIGNQKGVKGEELEWNGLKEFLKDKPSVTKQEIQDYLKENKVELQEVWRGDLKFDKKSKYAIPEVIRAVRQAGDTPGDLELVLANDGNAYRALTNKFPELSENENWAEIVSKAVFGGDTMPAGTSKYHTYQLPGGENYRELLLTLPSQRYQLKQLGSGRYAIRDTETNKFIRDASGAGRSFENANLAKQEIEHLNKINDNSKEYKSSHWDEPNILAHMRMNDRTIDGKKSLHLEEIQSDWHQQGRDKGYSSSKSKAEFDRLNKEFEDARSDLGFATEKKANELLGMSYQKYRAMYPAEKDEALKKLKEYRAQDPEYVALEKKVEDLEKARNAVNPSGGVPDAPFKKTWHELALKRAIREAAENGYERLSWTPGEAQAARYDLSKQLKELQYLKHDDGTYEIAGITSKGDGFNHPEKVTAAKLPDVVGKEMAEKIIKNEGKRNRGQPPNGGYFDGVDLKIGGEGMKGFYDQIIPKSIEKIAKEFGVKVQKTNLPLNKDQIKDLNAKYDDTKPDEIATAKYQDQWDKLVLERRKLQPLIDDRQRKLSEAEYQKVQDEWKEINLKMDDIHHYMVKETIDRMQSKLKGPETFYIDIPENMRQSIVGKGFPLFSGTPTLTPIDFDPFKEEQK